MRLLAVSTLGIAASLGATACAATAPALDSTEIAQGRWAVLAVILPGCPACEEALGWVGEVYQDFPQIGFLLLSPWESEEIWAASAELGLPSLVDEGGRMGAALGVRRAPTVVFLLDGEPVGLLPWPFGKGELERRLGELASAPRQGPGALLGTRVSLPEVQTFAGEPLRIQQPGEALVLFFFNPECPPCWRALEGLAALEEIKVVVVVLAPQGVGESERGRLAETGLLVVLGGAPDLAKTLGVRVTPTYMILDGEGVVRGVHEGQADPEVLRRAVEALRSEGLEGHDGS